MSLKDCLRRSQDAGEITLDERLALEKRYDALARQILAKGKAKEQLIAELELEAVERKRRALLTETARQQLDSEIFSHRDKDGRQNPAEAFMLLHEHFGQARFEDIENKRLAILGQAHAKMEALLAEFRKGAVMGDLRRRTQAVAAKLDNVVRELFGEDSGDASAKGLAQAWSDVAEDLRQRFNAAGGAIRKLEKWGLPQSHNPDALLKVGREKWVETILPMLDRDKMVSPLTGTRMTDDELVASLRTVWDRVTTDGWIDRDPSGQAGRGAMFKQHADHRFLHFKDAKTWLQYSRDFGEGDPFAAMMAHVGTMARDIAAMERLGPNPEAMRTYLKQRLQQQAAQVQPVARTIAEQTAKLKDLSARLSKPVARYEAMADRVGVIHKEMTAIRQNYRPQLGGKLSKRDKKKLADLQAEFNKLEDELLPYRRGEQPTVEADQAVAGEIAKILDEMKAAVPWPHDARPLDRAMSAIARADDMWAVQRGSLNTPVNSRVANALDATRNFVTAATLGSAALSAVSDVAFGKITRGFVGLPSGTIGVVKDVANMFRGAEAREAVRAGLILDSAVHAMHRQARYAGTMSSRTWTGFLADRVIGLSGLSAWTQAGKHAFGMAMQAEFADRILLARADLPEALRTTLDRHGISDAEWDQIRIAKLYEPEPGATFLRPAEIARAGGDKLAEKYLAMILRETRYAVPEPTVRASSLIRAGTRPGTIAGELTRSAAQFKSFGVAVVMLHGGRTARIIAGSGRAAGARYAGALLITGTLFGALAMQLKAISQGQDPRDMTDAGFWGAAALQGGGLGIYGDFLFSGVNRFGGSLSGTVAGPMWDRLGSARDLTVGNVLQLGEEKTNFGREAVNVLRQNTPGGSLWYMRAAYERIVLDQLQQLADPQARAAFRRKVSKRKKDYGNEFWWRPGETLPDRGPRLEGVAGR